MEMNVYAIKDLKMRTFMQPFFSANDDTVKRSFKYAINNKGGEIYIAREDLELWRLGTFDDKKGIFPDAIPEIIVNAGEMVERGEE